MQSYAWAFGIFYHGSMDLEGDLFARGSSADGFQSTIRCDNLSSGSKTAQPATAQSQRAGCTKAPRKPVGGWDGRSEIWQA
jgi:hypothetical protein